MKHIALSGGPAWTMRVHAKRVHAKRVHAKRVHAKRVHANCGTTSKQGERQTWSALCHAIERGMAHMRMSHGSHVNGSCLPCE